MPWRKQLKEYAASKNRTLISADAGIGLEFRDGCDVLWILPGEPGSTLPLPINAEIDPADVIAIYERIDALRSDVLHVVRRHCAEKGYHLSRSTNGEWGFSSNTISSGIDVGESLTVAALDSSTAAEVFTKWNDFQWMSDKPSPDRIATWLKEPLPAEVPERDDDESSGIVEAAQWSGVCSRLSALADMSPEEVKQCVADGAVPGPMVPERFIEILAELLPAVNASVDLCSDDRLRLEFSDALDEYTIKFTSQLFKRIETRGPESEAHDVAEEYLRRNRLRAKALNAIWSAAEKSNRKVERLNYSLFGGRQVYHIGKTTREISFDAGRRLTVRLCKLSPEETFHQAFGDDLWFADMCIQEYADALDYLCDLLPFGSLTPREVPAAPELLELTQSVTSRMDELARQAIDKLFAEPQVMHKYRDRNFIGEHDTWFDSSRWTDVALDYLSNEQWSDAATVILLDAGDPRAIPVARKIVAVQDEPHHEASDDVVELIWRFRHEFPDVARKWLGPNAFRDCYHDRLVSIGDPVSIRQEAARHRDLVRTLDEYPDEIELTAELVRSMQPAMVEQLHQQLRQWARETHLLAPVDSGQLQLAADMSWCDVFTALESNPWLLSTWLSSAERTDQFDEPGLLLSAEALLTWSRAMPTEFLGRIVATAFESDLVSLAIQAAERSASRNPAEQSFLPQCSVVYENWNQSLHSILAIAWYRCREYENQ